MICYPDFIAGPKSLVIHEARERTPYRSVGHFASLASLISGEMHMQYLNHKIHSCIMMMVKIFA